MILPVITVISALTLASVGSATFMYEKVKVTFASWNQGIFNVRTSPKHGTLQF